MAYDFAVKKAFHVASLQYTNFGIYCEVKCASGTISVGFNHYGRAEDYRLLRSTGKKDSHGKPIYEGQIIGLDAGKFAGLELLIIWDVDELAFKGLCLKSGYCQPLKSIEEFAIIGDDFEGSKRPKKV